MQNGRSRVQRAGVLLLLLAAPLGSCSSGAAEQEPAPDASATSAAETSASASATEAGAGAEGEAAMATAICDSIRTVVADLGGGLSGEAYAAQFTLKMSNFIIGDQGDAMTERVSLYQSKADDLAREACSADFEEFLALSRLETINTL